MNETPTTEMILQECDERVKRIMESYTQYSGINEVELICDAYQFAKVNHASQERATKEPYITHPISVAEILIELHVDAATLIAAFLHDIVEDTPVTLEEVTQRYGSEVALLVDGVTKLGRLEYNSREEQQADTFRRMFLAMAKDVRVVLIKLADRLHNMRTMKHKKRESQQIKAAETLDIYAPLAHRLGIYKIKWELEDLSLCFIDPDAYRELVSAIAQKREEREKFLENVVAELNSEISKLNLDIEIEGRPKHFYSIYKKMRAGAKELDDIFDLFACRIIVPTANDCYNVLGAVHQIYTPMPGRFKDYISMPKPNGYQSLHTTVISRNAVPFEVQIRSQEMHRIAEYGIAAHWRYKEDKTSPGKNEPIEDKLTWLRQLLEWSRETHDPSEFMAALKSELIEDEIFVFTPKGEVIALPIGAVPLDFAYRVHSEIGNSMVGAKVNGHMVAMDYQLQTGDIVTIKTDSNFKGPSQDWLKLVKSVAARNKIQAALRRSQRGENVVKGKEALEREIKKIGFEPAQLIRKEYIAKVLTRYSIGSLEDLHASIGYGGISVNRVITSLKDDHIRSLTEDERSKLGYRIGSNGQVIYSPNTVLSREELLKKEHPSILHDERKKRKVVDKGVEVTGLDGCLIKLSQCCRPVPGDAIIGFVTRGTGVSVHRTDCSNVRKLMDRESLSEKEQIRADRLIEVNWVEGVETTFRAELHIHAKDRNRLLADISNTISEEKVPIISCTMQPGKNLQTKLVMVIEVKDQLCLDRIVNHLMMIRDVLEVKRS